MSERHPTERPNSHEQGLVAGLVNAASGSLVNDCWEACAGY